MRGCSAPPSALRPAPSTAPQGPGRGRRKCFPFTCAGAAGRLPRAVPGKDDLSACPRGCVPGILRVFRLKCGFVGRRRRVVVGFPVFPGFTRVMPPTRRPRPGRPSGPSPGAPRRRVVSPPPRLPLPLTSQHFAELGPRRGSRRPSRPDLPPPFESALLRVHQTEPLVLVPSALPAGGSGPFGETCPMFCAAYICHLQGHWPRLSLWKVLRTRKWRKAEAAGSEQAPGAQRRETPKIRPHVAPSF